VAVLDIGVSSAEGSRRSPRQAMKAASGYPVARNTWSLAASSSSRGISPAPRPLHGEPIKDEGADLAAPLHLEEVAERHEGVVLEVAHEVVDGGAEEGFTSAGLLGGRLGGEGQVGGAKTASRTARISSPKARSQGAPRLRGSMPRSGDSTAPPYMTASTAVLAAPGTEAPSWRSARMEGRSATYSARRGQGTLFRWQNWRRSGGWQFWKSKSWWMRNAMAVAVGEASIRDVEGAAVDGRRGFVATEVSSVEAVSVSGRKAKDTKLSMMWERAPRSKRSLRVITPFRAFGAIPARRKEGSEGDTDLPAKNVNTEKQSRCTTSHSKKQ
jgi:hypothetical protein